MNEEEIVQKTRNYVRRRLEGEGSGHDWWHIERVWRNALKIGKEENADMYVVQLAALLHDIEDFKLHGGDTTVGENASKEYLRGLGTDENTIDHVAEIVGTLSFKGAGEEKPMTTLEGKVVRDADRLDALGAIGIARCFAYGGHKGTPIHTPGTKPKLHETKEEYIKRQSSQINHFHEKLLLLKDLMLTDAGKRMAQERHNYMEKYLEQFHAEWNGER